MDLTFDEQQPLAVCWLVLRKPQWMCLESSTFYVCLFQSQLISTCTCI